VHYTSYRGKARLWTGLLVLLLSACRANGIPGSTPATVEAALLTQSSQCWNDGMEPSVVWISNIEAYKSAYKQTRKHILDDSGYLPNVDFNRSGVIAVYMGKHSTAGYQVGLASGTAAISGHDLTLLVSWVEPPADALMAQVITSPCVLVSIPKGDYAAIRVVDEAGRLRASSKLLENQ